ncbi:hypothetical protein XELAEV_18013803mg [Xenopus laevis]|uniref:Uncharacterized protein n=1 Tax=Xenopus laevis TaxID=8355 RepID=A0A974DRE6_XENLA|nr:hypothetical protein XELAEV_18013803mg [Xenopus laevis]
MSSDINRGKASCNASFVCAVSNSSRKPLGLFCSSLTQESVISAPKSEEGLSSADPAPLLEQEHIRM